ncbi:hypothetical protein ACFYSC_33700 [Streptosporangium sp. NPDC004379]|uniref:hypothetical protein n=1 Tax=Streptosporangium sp. NPDC004379 TaxID=3366189 RepID=UPI0036C3D054
MTEKEFQLPEMAVLVVLMAETEGISNPELQERYGLKLDGKSRKKLNDLKLVESRKQGRAFVHTLTDHGWARMGEMIEAGIPLPSGSAGAMCRVLLTGLSRFLTRTGQAPADFFHPGSDLYPGGDEDGPLEEAPDGAGPPAGEADVTERIRAAYAELAPRPGARVGLARLRPLLGGFTRDEVDRALKGMIHLPEVSIVPENNQKTLTPEDRAAAVVIGDQDKHLISIGAR